MEPVKVGIVGCGAISGIYLKNARTLKMIEVVACADLVLERAKARAEEFGVPKACTVDELLADPSIELVVNLTVPQAHAEVALRAVRAGKSVYNEKPLTVERDEAKLLLKEAKERGVLVGAAPDTFLGAGLQTCRKLIDEGWIGEPVGASAFMLIPGHEFWHPDPVFYYKRGGGPMFDMGPYYLTALVNLIGPVRRVTGSTRITYPERTILSKPKYGQKITVETPTHIAGVMDFANGAIGTIVTSFDVWGGNVPHIEIYGTEGTLSAPDPNLFGGPVRVRKKGSWEWQEVPLTHGYSGNCRGLGIADMAYALRTGRPHRANGELAYHVLDIMHAFEEASTQGRHIVLESGCERPAPLPEGLPLGELDP